jgi:ferredoxin
MELDDEDGRGRLEEGLEFASRAGVRIQPIAGRIAIDEEKCIDCGACTGPCLAGALALDPEDWKLRFDSGRCVLCKICVESCPLGAIRVEF